MLVDIFFLALNRARLSFYYHKSAAPQQISLQNGNILDLEYAFDARQTRSWVQRKYGDLPIPIIEVYINLECRNDNMKNKQEIRSLLGK